MQYRSSIISIITGALNLIDKRLVAHGKRVAYIVYKMYESRNNLSPTEMNKICLVSLFHDIGAYKTEEIDNLFSFEVSEGVEHSLYGYLFLKYLTPLSDKADAILYHHSNVSTINKSNCRNKELARIIHLADLIDNYVSKNKSFNSDEMKMLRTTAFSDYIDKDFYLFLKAD